MSKSSTLPCLNNIGGDSLPLPSVEAGHCFMTEVTDHISRDLYFDKSYIVAIMLLALLLLMAASSVTELLILFGHTYTMLTTSGISKYCVVPAVLILFLKNCKEIHVTFL
jgi:hypothetical protein